MACRFCSGQHYKAILYRKKIMLKRSYKGLVGALVAIVLCSILVIIVNVLFKSLGKTEIEPLSFKNLEYSDQSIAWIGGDGGGPEIEYYHNVLNAIYTSDTGKPLQFTTFQNNQEFNKAAITETKRQFFNFGLGFDTANMSDNEFFTVYYNESRTKEMIFGEYAVTRLAWKSILGDQADFTVSLTTLDRRSMDHAFGFIAPLLISFAVLSVVPLIIGEPINDITGPVRNFMMSCELTIPAYWFATFTVDMIIWVVACMLMWLILAVSTISTFIDNLFNMWYALILSGPSLILFLYCFSFCFSNPRWAISQAFLALLIIEILPVLNDAMMSDLPAALEWFWSLFPPLYPQRILASMFMFTGTHKKSLSWFFTYEKSQPGLLMQLVMIVVWGSVLCIIEKARIALRRCNARLQFRRYKHVFEEKKTQQPMSEETAQMAQEVESRTDFAIRVHDVSRLFFNAAGKPVTAVNHVSLGVEEGSTFGFLGANGAGKTTLIQMITSQLPVSAGEIEVMGTPITQMTGPQVAICPQFNTHLCPELTPNEHFKLYSMLFSSDCTQDQINDLIDLLDFHDIKDIPIRDLSEGDCRKMAIALSFLGPAKIILLDEPTATLDSSSRLHVYELIKRYKGRKTFMLCTHLLGEAEALCDKLSIMVKGSVYTVGTPQYLSSKFGTEFKIDVMLQDETKACGDKCTNFMSSTIPEAVLSIQRPKTRIYNVPSHSITLPTLFERMEAGMSGKQSGIAYYTCSSSSLERVFMEIVKSSSTDDDQEKSEKEGSEPDEQVMEP